MPSAVLIPSRDSRPLAPTRASSDAHLMALWLHVKSPHSQRAYQRAALRFLTVHAPQGLHHVTLEDVHAWADALAQRGLKASSRALKMAAVKSLMTFAHQVGYLPFNVGRAVRLPKVEDRLAQRILAEAQVLRIMACCCRSATSGAACCLRATWPSASGSASSRTR